MNNTTSTLNSHQHDIINPININKSWTTHHHERHVIDIKIINIITRIISITLPSVQNHEQDILILIVIVVIIIIINITSTSHHYLHDKSRQHHNNISSASHQHIDEHNRYRIVFINIVTWTPPHHQHLIIIRPAVKTGLIGRPKAGTP